jgi:hypothetical protein
LWNSMLHGTVCLCLVHSCHASCTLFYNILFP